MIIPSPLWIPSLIEDTAADVLHSIHAEQRGAHHKAVDPELCVGL